MSPESVMDIGYQAIYITTIVASPMLLTALIVGLIVSIFQAATQINEATLSFIPKLFGILAVLGITGPWMITVMTDYMRQVFTNIPMIAG
ncbi:MAG: flagellar biosynthetic protein FliQ [Betaproteobacteria bacterium HGW-Betaproteobacteria-8]|nr:MAG: flagellar biosynthetic protein FliQ [Betaproteobacteria bacterium HGW-Betaproteobacteria-8]